MENVDYLTRLTQSIEYLKDNGKARKHEDIAELMGSPRPNVTAALKGNPKYLTKGFLTRFAKAYGDYINLDWLLTGEGEMIKGKNEEVVIDVPESLPAVISYEDGVPYYNETFECGFSELSPSQVSRPDFLIRMPGYERATVWCNASGHSMSPEISNGDIIALQKIHDPSFLPFGDIYAIVTTNDMRTIKRLGRSDLPDHYRLIPTNPEYDAQDIPVRMIRTVFKVLGAMKSFV